MITTNLTEHSSKGLYREAFKIYCEWPADKEPSIPSIAKDLGINPETLTQFAMRRNWVQMRSHSLAQRITLEGGQRAILMAQLDANAVKKMSTWFATIASRIDELIGA